MSTKILPSPFPVELVENVLEHAYAEYRPLEKPVTLYQCALVCQTWRIIAQSLIFSECVLSLGSPQIESLKRDDTIRHLVRRVWVKVLSGSSVNELSGLLPGLQEVYVLSQLDELFTFLTDPHTELPKPFMLANDTFVLGNLTSFGLSSISFPLKLFRHCTSLRELKINRCVFEHEDDADSLHAPQQLMLHSFHLRAHTHQEMDVISWMLSSNSPFNWTQLTTLRVCNQTHKFKTHKLVEALVERCASTLEDLMVEPPNGYPKPDDRPYAPGNGLNPSTFHNLRFIRIPVKQAIEHSNFVPWLTAFFSLLPADTKIEDVSIPCLFPVGYKDWSTNECNLHQYGWESLDNALSSLPTLKKVVISVVESESTSRKNLETLRPHFWKGFPGLTERGIFHVTNSPQFGYASKEECWWLNIEP